MIWVGNRIQVSSCFTLPTVRNCPIRDSKKLREGVACTQSHRGNKATSGPAQLWKAPLTLRLKPVDHYRYSPNWLMAGSDGHTWILSVTDLNHEQKATFESPTH